MCLRFLWIAVMLSIAVLSNALPAAAHDSFTTGVVEKDFRVGLVELHANFSNGDAIRGVGQPYIMYSSHSFTLTPYNGPIRVGGFYFIEVGEDDPQFGMIWSLDSTDGAPRSGSAGLTRTIFVPDGVTKTSAWTSCPEPPTGFAVEDKHFLIGDV